MAALDALNQDRLAAASVVSISQDKTFKKITQSNNSTNYTVSWKEFSSITTNTVSSNKYNSTKYYAFGTTFFMDDKQESPITTGGLCFAVDNSGKTGYFIQLDTTTNAAAQNAKELTIFKAYTATVNGVITPGKKIKLTDSQATNVSSLNGVYGGLAYNIDCKIKSSDIGVEIKVWVNGFLVTATDRYLATSSNVKIENKLIPITKNVGVFVQKGTCYFDYVYALEIKKSEYDINVYQQNKYNGQFSRDALNTSFGNMTLQNDTSNDLPVGAIDEFGPIAREIYHVNTKFENRPVMPNYFSTGSNKYITVLASRLTNFEAEAFVLNNSSSFIPLEDAGNASFYVVGNSIGKSGQIENVIETTTNQYIKKEPTIFESEWIQSNEDANALGNWIKNNAISKGKVVDLEIFGNPLIAVGDIISIVYPYQNLAEGNSVRFVVNTVSHTYSDGGLSTSITCRTL